MKHILLFTFLLLTALVFSQNSRIEIEGVIVSNHNDVEGVTVYNLTTQKGTITKANGHFSLQVAEHDILEISALQFLPQTVRVTKQTIETGILRILLTEKVNSLDEVLVFSSDLTGLLDVDVENVEEIEVNPLANMSLGDIKNMNFEIDHLTKVDNQLMKQGQFYNGVDFAALLSLFFKRKKKPIKNYRTYEPKKISYPKDISNKYSNQFIANQFGVPKDEVEAFYAFCYRKGFDDTLLLPKNEVYLLEYFSKMSQKYVSENNTVGKD
ncbi:carboxypeptidase-like regulatory domain-containing protein [Mangrovimonas spongiae]|uniref:carboxypeptidase-like regulatory domain-containing protein n=1 Tax=Mangrovimonas spongiae TaxID=2494697 RepID=UPI0013159351|nr:carboxypeptidase-like regulatory domain-containing protein [Mangrovimonas spongiae]